MPHPQATHEAVLLLLLQDTSAELHLRLPLFFPRPQCPSFAGDDSADSPADGVITTTALPPQCIPNEVLSIIINSAGLDLSAGSVLADAIAALATCPPAPLVDDGSLLPNVSHPGDAIIIDPPFA